MFTKKELLKLALAGPEAIDAMRTKLKARVADPKFAAKKSRYEKQLAQLDRAEAAGKLLDGEG